MNMTEADVTESYRRILDLEYPCKAIVKFVPGGKPNDTFAAANSPYEYEQITLEKYLSLFGPS